MLSICTFDGCPNIAARRGRCESHPYPRSPSSRITGTTEWKRLRKRVLVRDGFTCRYCGAPADTVDKLQPASLAEQSFLDEDYVAACGHCNFSKGNRTWPDSLAAAGVTRSTRTTSSA